MARRIKCLWVGKLKSGFWKEAAEHYLSQIGKYYFVEEITVRDAPGGLAPEERIRRESQALEKQCGSRDLPVCLDRSGSLISSERFASTLQQWLEGPHTPCFIIGGAYGISQNLIRSSHYCLSLGHMTLPHELSRIVLLEQIYRAATILWGHPYHH